MTTTPSSQGSGGEPDEQPAGSAAEQGARTPSDDTPGAEIGITEGGGSTFEPEEDAEAPE